MKRERLIYIRKCLLVAFLAIAIFIAGFLSGTYVWGSGSYTTISSSGVNTPGWMNASSFKFNDEFWYGSYNRTDVFAHPEQTASYIIFTDGSMVYAKNGETGQIEFQSTNASYVIQSAMDTLGTAGGVIFVKGGEYTITSRVLVKQGYANIILEGEGERTVFEATITDKLYGVFQIHADTQNIIIQNFKIVGGTDQKTNEVIGIKLDGTNITNIRISNVWIESFGYGILVNDYSDFRVYGLIVEGCILKDIKYVAMNILDCENARIVKNRIYDTDYSGIEFRGRNSIISGNTIENYGRASSYKAAIKIENPRADGEYTRSVSVCGNSIRHPSNPGGPTHGILISGEQQYDSYIEGVSITGNSIFGIGSGQNSAAGIYLHTRTAPTKLNNVLKVSITGNVVVGFNTGAILAGSDITFVGNTLYDVQIGVWSNSPYRTLIAFNEIYGAGTTTEDFDGIRLNGANKVIVQGNHIENFYCGITEVYSDYANGDYHIIKDNRIENIGPGGAIEKAGTNTVVSQNTGYVTEASGTASVSNGDYIAHGLAGKPTTVILTCMNATYDGVPVIVNCDYANTNSTHICVSLYWTNGTAITTPLLVSWYAEYKP